jgi:predicted metal-dependent phosphoesterase TrpH
MRWFVDLHTHSTASDGSLRPAEVIALAEAKKLLAVALTDHDTTAGLAEAKASAGRFPHLRFIPGIEVSAAFPAGTLHILGLGIDENSPALANLAADLRAARADRNPKIVAKLQAMGLKIDMDDVAAQAGPWPVKAPCASTGMVSPASTNIHTVPRLTAGATTEPPVLGRLHIARAMVARRCIRSVNEAFKRYIGRRAPAFVEKDKLPAAAVIAAIHSSGGLAALAHPPQLRYSDLAHLERITKDLIASGMDAIEVYNSDHSDRQTRSYLQLAQSLNLGIVGGSDFHGPIKPTVRLGRPKVSISMLANLVADRLLGGGSMWHAHPRA